MTEERAQRHLAAILAADVVGYSRLMEQDEADTFAQLRMHRRELFEPEINKHRGRIFKLMGDGLLAEFGSVADAVECAVVLQRGMAERNNGVSIERRIDVRIGINLGDVIVEGEDRHGEGVNIACRLQQLAEPGGICVSGKVAKEVEKKLAFGFESMGEQKVKNIAEPIPTFRVKLEGPPTRRPSMRRRILPWQAVAAAVIAIIVIVGTWFAYVQTGPPAQTPIATVPSVAVLPFDNMSGDSAMAYFADGVSEDIISMLSRSPDVLVVARNSSFTYKGKATDARQIGKELNVGYVLEGSVRKEADKVRIVAQLIDAKTGEHVWAERFDKTGTDPWALQDEVTGKIIGALTGEKGQLKQAQYHDAWGKDSANLQEYDYYLRGHALFMQFTAEGVEQAGQIWEEGLAKFPNSALLQVNLGWYHMGLAYNGFSNDPTSDFRKAGELVRQALAHPNLSPLERRLCHWLFAYVNLWERKFDQALKEAETAKSLAPYDAFMIGDLCTVLYASGRPMQAVEWADTARARDPANAAYYNGVKGWALEIAGKPQESLAALDSGMFWGDLFPFVRAIVLVRLNRIDEARAEVKKGLAVDSSYTQAKWRKINIYSDPSILDNEVADLARAGLPEK
jgi:adenylate cyclase